jgi:hypothetical protein
LESLSPNGRVNQVASAQVYLIVDEDQTYEGNLGFKELRMLRTAAIEGSYSPGDELRRRLEKINGGGAKTNRYPPGTGSVTVFGSSRGIAGAANGPN